MPVAAGWATVDRQCELGTNDLLLVLYEFSLLLCRVATLAAAGARSCGSGVANRVFHGLVVSRISVTVYM